MTDQEEVYIVILEHVLGDDCPLGHAFLYDNKAAAERAVSQFSGDGVHKIYKTVLEEQHAVPSL